MLKMVLPSEAWVKVKLLSPQPSVYSQHFKNLAISFSNVLMLSPIDLLFLPVVSWRLRLSEVIQCSDEE